MKQDKAQQATRDEKLVPSDDRVKIGKSILRMDPFFGIDNKTCQIDVELFREILDICPRVQNQEFIEFLTSDSLLEFLLDLGYKGQLKQISEMYVDHMHQPCRTFGAIISRCLSEKTLSDDRLRLSRIEILWRIYHNANVDYAALIWEDLQYQIDYRKSKVKRREPENKLTGRKKRTPRAVVIQEPLSVPLNKTQESPGKLKGAGLIPKVPDELTRESADSDKGVGTSREVPDESEDKSEARDDLDDWNSTYDESGKGVAEMNIAEEAEEENTERVKAQKDDEELKADEEQKEDDQAGDEQLVVPISTTQKENSNLLQSTSSHSVSSNLDVPHIEQEPFHVVKVSVIPKTTQQPPSTPPAPPLPATKIPSTQVSNSEAVKSVVQRFTKLEQVVKELKQADHSTTILASIRSQVPSIVENYLGSSLPDALKKLFGALTWSMLLDEANMNKGDKPDTVLKKRD
ncbi:hypothetical protein Tco_0365214 [Tanacetum coccineum]